MTHPNAWPDSPPPRRGLVQIEPHELAVCTANRCKGGRKECPCPEACVLPEDDARVYASGWVHALVYGTSAAVSLLGVAVLLGWL